MIKDERNHVPLKLARDAQVLYLSVLDYPSRMAHCRAEPHVHAGAAAALAECHGVELSDRTTASELELVRAMAPRYDAVVASVFVRTASFSGRMDLAPALQRLLHGHRAADRDTKQPVRDGRSSAIRTSSTFLPDLPAVLLTYDFYDRAGASAVRALAGEAAIGGALPIAMPGLAKRGSGSDAGRLFSRAVSVNRLGFRDIDVASCCRCWRLGPRPSRP